MFRPSRRPSRMTLAAAIASACFAVGAPATAQDAPEFDREAVRALIADLGAADFETRESADLTLREMRLSPEQVAACAPPVSELSPEQWARLGPILKQRFFDSPRAGLGVSFDNTREVDGVAIGKVMERFPAASVLRDGDVIVEINGHRLNRNSLATGVVQCTIVSHDPGETVSMTVRRSLEAGADEETIRITAPLGSFSDLGQGGAMSPTVLEAAWQIRAQRLGLAAPEPLIIAAANLDRTNWPQRLIANAIGRVSDVVAGGGAGTDEGFMSRIEARTLTSSAVTREMRGIRVQNGRPVRLIDQTRRIDQRAQLIGLMREHVRNLELLRTRANDPTLPAAERQRAQSRIEQIQEDLRELQAAIIDLNGDR